MKSIDIIRAAYNSNFEKTSLMLKKFPWQDDDHYTQWLIQTYHYVKHTTRLTALAAARLSIKDTHLHQHMLDHAAEEKAHEQLILNDLKALGFDYPTLLDKMEFSITKAFYQSLYYQIDSVSPWALFGRVIPLEGLAATVGALAANNVYNKDTCSFLLTHADADPGHVERAFDAVKDVSLEEANIIAEGIVMTFELYNLMLDTVENFCWKSDNA